MGRSFFIAAALFFSALPARAARTGDLGAGVLFGSPTGITAKWWRDDAISIDGGIGFGDAAVFYADVSYNDWRAYRLPWNGETNVYLSAGPRIASDDGGQFGLRAMVGAAFWPRNRPLEFFAEFGPVFKLAPDHNVGVDGAVGIRYYFTVTIEKLRP